MDSNWIGRKIHGNAVNLSSSLRSPVQFTHCSLAITRTSDDSIESGRRVFASSCPECRTVTHRSRSVSFHSEVHEPDRDERWMQWFWLRPASQRNTVYCFTLVRTPMSMVHVNIVWVRARVCVYVRATHTRTHIIEGRRADDISRLSEQNGFMSGNYIGLFHSNW